MRSSWDEVEKLFINHWRKESTPLHLVFVGKRVPLSLNASVVIGEAVATPILGSKFLVLQGKGLECFVASDAVVEIEYSEPNREITARERYTCFIEFKSADGSELVLGELSIDTGSAPR